MDIQIDNVDDDGMGDDAFADDDYDDEECGSAQEEEKGKS